MALLSKQVTPTKTLDDFLVWCVRNGYSVGENPRHGTKVVTPGVHKAGSFHYAGLAADINAGANGPQERARLLVALNEAVSRGLAVTYARDGVVGSAKSHQNHLHVDVGEWSNVGKGAVRKGSVKVVSGPVSDVLVLKAQKVLKASYPLYAKHLVPDGINGQQTTAALKEFQRRSGLTMTGKVDPATRKALGI